MKLKELKALQAKSVDELQKLLIDGRDGLFSLKMDLKQFKLKNTGLLSMKQKDIARIKTILREKELVKND